MITEKTFLSELLEKFPEFVELHESNKQEHDSGIHLIFGTFRRFVEEAIQSSNAELLFRIKEFILRCYESKDEVKNALFVSFFENLNKEGLKYFYNNLPPKFVTEIKEFLPAFDIASAKGSILRLWEEFRGTSFPKELHDDKYYDLHLELMDSHVAGCISSYINAWNLETMKRNILEDFIKNYGNTVHDFTANGRVYFDKLKEMATLILKIIKIDIPRTKDL